MTALAWDKRGVHFEKRLEIDTQVHIPGTGTLGFHTDNIKLSQSIFLVPNMTDIWLAVHAHKNKIRCRKSADIWRRLKLTNVDVVKHAV